MTAISVTVTLVTPDFQEVVSVTLEAGATVADAVDASGLLSARGFAGADLACARFGRRVDAGSTVHDGDRIDITRPIAADPKDARRRRAAHRTNR